MVPIRGGYSNPYFLVSFSLDDLATTARPKPSFHVVCSFTLGTRDVVDFCTKLDLSVLLMSVPNKVMI